MKKSERNNLLEKTTDNINKDPLVSALQDKRIIEDEKDLQDEILKHKKKNILRSLNKSTSITRSSFLSIISKYFSRWENIQTEST